ncbi:hypothetical protein OAO87_03675 [bacterium]|nr:hypothetical protein [bacterium]
MCWTTTLRTKSESEDGNTDEPHEPSRVLATWFGVERGEVGGEDGRQTGVAAWLLSVAWAVAWAAAVG